MWEHGQATKHLYESGFQLYRSPGVDQRLLALVESEKRGASVHPVSGVVWGQLDRLAVQLNGLAVLTCQGEGCSQYKSEIKSDCLVGGGEDMRLEGRMDGRGGGDAGDEGGRKRGRES